MLSNAAEGEWELDSLAVGAEPKSPDSEVKITVLEKTGDTVTVHIKYRENEKTMTLSPSKEEKFSDEANAYGFSYVFTIKE